MLLVLVVGSSSSNSKPSSVVESSWLGMFETNPVGWNMVKRWNYPTSQWHQSILNWQFPPKKRWQEWSCFFGVTYKSVYPNDGETSLYWHQKSLSTLPRSPRHQIDDEGFPMEGSEGWQKYHSQALAQSLLGNAQTVLQTVPWNRGVYINRSNWMTSGSIKLTHLGGYQRTLKIRVFGIVILQLQWMELHPAFWPKNTEETENSTAGQHYGPHQDEADSLVWMWMMNEEWGNTKIAPSLRPFESNHWMLDRKSVV